MEPQKIAMMFDSSHQAGSYADIEHMQEQINALGGMLHFTISKQEDGWIARCNEVEGLITGGTSPTPSDFEIQSQIREAIYTAFNIKTQVAPETLRSEVTQLAVSFA